MLNAIVSVDQSTHFHGSISGSNVAVHSQVGSQPSTLSPDQNALIDRISSLLAQDQEVAEAQRHELLDDIRNLRAELQRARPRGGIVREILATLGDIASICGLVIQLQQSLPFLFR